MAFLLTGCGWTAHSVFLEPSAPGAAAKFINDNSSCEDYVWGVAIVPPDQDWLLIRVYATLPNQNHRDLTMLTISVGKNLKLELFRDLSVDPTQLPHPITTVAKSSFVLVNIPGYPPRRMPLTLLSQPLTIDRGYEKEYIAISPNTIEFFSVEIT